MMLFTYLMWMLLIFAAECFVVRTENSEDHRQIGSRGAMCLLHVSKFGLTLALQVLSSLCLILKLKGKGKGNCIAVHGTPSHSYGVSLAIWDHTVLPATRHR